MLKQQLDVGLLEMIMIRCDIFGFLREMREWWMTLYDVIPCNAVNISA